MDINTEKRRGTNQIMLDMKVVIWIISCESENSEDQLTTCLTHIILGQWPFNMMCMTTDYCEEELWKGKVEIKYVQ